jgi:hypothetical protein
MGIFEHLKSLIHQVRLLLLAMEDKLITAEQTREYYMYVRYSQKFLPGKPLMV